MAIPRRPPPNPNYDSGRRDLIINGHCVSASLTELRRDDPGRRHGATHIITVTPPANTAVGTIIEINNSLWRVVASRRHPTLKNYLELIVSHQKS